jgi:hypothetical protein
VGHPQIAAFARLANGGAKAIRAIAGQNTLFSRTIHDMAYDDVRDEILVPSHYLMGIVTFRGDANGNVSPVRKIFGPKTQILLPDAVAIDPVHGEIFVPGRNPNRVLVFSRDADGDVAPIRILEGPDTGLTPNRIAIDPVRNLMVVSSGGRDGLRIYDRTASGNTKPLRYINGPGAKDVWLLTVNSDNGMIFAVSRPGVIDSAEGDISGRFGLDDYVGVWSIYDDGNVPARYTIGGPNLLLKDARGIALDKKNKNVIVSDKTLNAILTFHVPEAF